MQEALVSCHGNASLVLMGEASNTHAPSGIIQCDFVMVHAIRGYFFCLKQSGSHDRQFNSRQYAYFIL
jgi:hypothetical protein